MARKTGLVDFETEFGFYRAYHSNPVNILLHTLFVWPVFFTLVMLFYFTPSVYDIPQIGFFDHGLPLNLGFFFTLIVALLYVSLDKKAGTLAALICFACWVCASFLAGRLGYSLAWKVVLVAQLISWTGQSIGHGVFEKRAAAPLNNLAQQLFAGPFFVLLEVLQKAFGYEPYPGFYASVKAKTQAEMKEWQDRKDKKLS